MIQDLIDRHFEATKQRGLITKKTTISTFISKMMEEDHEMYDELIKNMWGERNSEETTQEIIDSVMVRINFLKQKGIDFELALCRNVMKQELRAKEHINKLKEQDHGKQIY